MRLRSKYAIITYLVLSSIFLIFGIFFYYVYSGTIQDKTGFLLVFSGIALILLLTSVYHVFRYVDFYENITIRTVFNKTVINIKEITVIEIHTYYETNGIYNVLRTQHIKAVIKTKNRTIIFRYLGKLNKAFWDELSKQVKVKIVK